MTKRIGTIAGLFLVAVALPVALVRGADAPGVTGDLKVMQGKWDFTADAMGATWLLEGETLRVTFNDLIFVCKVTLDPKASPREVDFFVKEGPNEVVGKTTLGIYKIEDDAMTFCVRRPGETPRPAEFKEVDDECFVFSIKKAK